MKTFGFVFEVQLASPAIEKAESVQESLLSSWDARIDKAGGRWLLTVYVDGWYRSEAYREVMRDLPGPVSVFSVLRLDDDLVAASDIASRMGVSRQAVQQFVGHEGFPMPWCVVASTRVWRWAEVNEWLRSNRPDRADTEYWPLAADALRINAMLAVTRGDALINDLVELRSAAHVGIGSDRDDPNDLESEPVIAWVSHHPAES